MPVIRAHDIPSVDIGGSRLELAATPANGATETTLLRGIVPAGAGFPPHSHDHEEVLLMITGSGRFTVAGVTEQVSAGDVVIVPTGALHSYEADEDTDAVAVLLTGTKMFDPDGNEISRS